MNNINSMKKVLCFLLIAALSISAYGCKETTKESKSISSESSFLDTPEGNSVNEAASTEYSALFSDRDKNPEFDNISAEIVLKNNSAQIDGDGVSINGSQITITKEGIYRISGTLDDGQIIVNADKAKVQLILDNADITCKNSSPIYGVDSDKIFISLAEGSKNTLTDGTSYDFADETSEEPDACIFSSDSVTINGTGVLNINANFADGIHSKDDIVITGGNINITSAGDGIKGKDYVAICGGNIDITSGQDGIKSTKIDDASLGFVYIEGGNFCIDAKNDGIQAETDLIVAGGNFDIISGGGSENSTKIHSDMEFGGDRGIGGFGKGEFMQPDDSDFENMTPPEGFDKGRRMHSDDFDFENMTPPEGFDNNEMIRSQTQDEQTATDNSTSTESTKGLKGGTSVKIIDGEISVDSADDAVHSNGDVVISGSSLVLASGDKGIHADSLVTIEGGNVVISKSYEGIEATVININDGTIDLKASDDGLNASDGSGGMMGVASSGVELNISGGTLYVDADGDGIDSNANMTINGGTVIVNGPTDNSNGSLDSETGIYINGGLVIAAGSSGMTENPESLSKQNCVSAVFNSSLEAGTLVTLCDSTGNEIISFAPSKTFSHIIISSPDIKDGESYTLYTGGTSSAEEVNGLYKIGGYNNDAEEFGSFTVDDSVSYIGTQNGMMGNNFGRGKQH